MKESILQEFPPAWSLKAFNFENLEWRDSYGCLDKENLTEKKVMGCLSHSSATSHSCILFPRILCKLSAFKNR